MTDVRREWFDTDFYAVLGVSKDASPKEITRAYRQLARELHPDANPDDPAAEERFKAVSAAYDVVGDDERRKAYDRARSMGPIGGAFGGGGSAGGFDLGDMGDLGDLLGSMFGGGGGAGGGGLFGGGGAPPRRPRARRGQDQEAHLSLTFDEALDGATTEVAISDPRSGPRNLKVRIPAGVEQGQRIRLRGKGGAGEPPGDLFVIIDVAAHRIFGRAGRNLTLSLPVTFAEAALGADVRVPTRAGTTVTLRIPPGTQTGRTFRVKNEGALTADGRGDLLVTVEVAVPSKLSAAQRKALEAFASLSDQSPRSHLEQ